MSNLLHPLNIGGVTLDNNIILAPMAGVTALPFRLLCREQGSALQCMEMVSAKAIMYGNKNRNNISEISNILDKAEEQFAAGEFMNANELAKEALTKIKQTNGRK